MDFSSVANVIFYAWSLVFGKIACFPANADCLLHHWMQYIYYPLTELFVCGLFYCATDRWLKHKLLMLCCYWVNGFVYLIHQYVQLNVSCVHMSGTEKRKRPRNNMRKPSKLQRVEEEWHLLLSEQRDISNTAYYKCLMRKGPRAKTRTRDSRSTTALYVGALVTRPSAPTQLTCILKHICTQCVLYIYINFNLHIV